MNKNKAKGTVDEVAGRTKRQVGEWTGDTSAQVKGGTQEIKGKLERAIGHLQDVERHADDKADKTDQEHTATKRP